MEYMYVVSHIKCFAYRTAHQYGSTKKLKKGIWSLFSLMLTLWNGGHEWRRVTVIGVGAYYTYYMYCYPVIHRAISIMHTLFNPRGKCNSCFLGRLGYEKICRYNNSAPVVTPIWLPQQILPLNFLGIYTNEFDSTY